MMSYKVILQLVGEKGLFKMIMHELLLCCEHIRTQYPLKKHLFFCINYQSMRMTNDDAYVITIRVSESALLAFDAS